MLVAIDDTLEGGHGVQAHSLAKTRGLLFHGLQRGEVLAQHPGLFLLATALGFGDSRLQGLHRHRHLEQLLLVHLQGAVAAAHAHAPHTIAYGLYFHVPGGLDVQLHQHVLVVADPGGLHLVEDFPHHFRGARGLADTQDALALATATADGLEADPVVGVLPGHLLDRLGEGVAQFRHRVEVYALVIGGRQYQVGLVLQ